MIQFVLLMAAAGVSAARAQDASRDIPYAGQPGERRTLDVHAPAGAKHLPVLFWIHGGGWQQREKTDVNVKPKAFMERGFVFVSMNGFLRGDPCLEGQGDPAVPDPARGEPSRHVGAGVRAGRGAQGGGVPATLFRAKDTNHVKLNDDIGLPGDAATAALFEFVAKVMKK